MADKFFDLLNVVFKLMMENKLKKDIDDTLFEKLLTFVKKCRLNLSDMNGNVISVDNKDQANACPDFIKELVKRTEALHFIGKVASSIIENNEHYTIALRSFAIRFIGLVLESPEGYFPCESLLPLLKSTDGKVITDHVPSVQDALLVCLCCITKQFEGALWFIDNDLKDFVLSSFNSSSYYVRKSAASFFVNFILQWTQKPSCMEQKKPKEIYLENFIEDLVSFIIDHIHVHNNSREVVFAECCILVLKQLFELKNTEIFVGDHLSLAKNVSECFLNLTEEKELSNKLTDLLLNIHLVFVLPDEIINNVIKCLILKEDIKLAIDLASSFASIAESKQCCPENIKFFLLPLHILMNVSLSNCENFYGVESAFVLNILSKKMELKTECKVLFSSSLTALQKIAPNIDSDNQRSLGMEMLKVSKYSSYPHHKWLYSVLEDRIVHHCIIEFYSCLLSDNVYPSMKYKGSDLAFQGILEFLKKPTIDSNFLSQLLLLMKGVLILHKKFQYNSEETEIDDLMQILCRVLHDNRESVVDSGIHLAGQVSTHPVWKDKFFKKGVHSIIWDIAIHGSLDGTVRSTALKIIINSCLDAWFLNELKLSKGVTEKDIVKILFDLTYDPDFFLQREALSCLFSWMKPKWNEFQPLCKDYLYTALVSAIKSLDLELKLISLDVWLWLLENEFVYSVTSSTDAKVYIEHLVKSGFGLSMILAFEDYDEAVQYKAASILCNLKQKLLRNESSFESLKTSSIVENETTNCVMSESIFEPISKEDRDRGIDTVMELTTTEQITKICRPTNLSELYNFKQEYYPNDNKDRTCSVSSFWTCLWSENVISILQPNKLTDITDGESLLNDIISARVMDCDAIEDTPDCY